jgi:hypothetical protein
MKAVSPGRELISWPWAQWSYAPQTEDTATIRPARRFIMAAIAARQSWNVPSSPASVTARQSSSVSIVSGWSLAIPAQLTTAVTGPSSSCVRSNQDLTSPGSQMSAWIAATRAPSSEAAFSTRRAASASSR